MLIKKILENNTDGDGGNHDSVNYVSEEERQQPSRRSKGKLFVFLAVAIVALVGGSVAYWYRTRMQSPEYQAAKTQQANTAILEKVGSFIMLPKDEQPTFFDIADPEGLIKQQPFFTGVIKGDKLIIFAKAAKAILYSPSRNILINVGPLTVNGTSPAQAVTGTKTPVKK